MKDQTPCVHSWTRNRKAMECRGNIENEAEWLDEATRGLRKLRGRADHQMQYRFASRWTCSSQKAQSVANVREGVAGYSTGLKDSDRLTAGWHVGASRS